MYIEQRLPFEAPQTETRLELGEAQHAELSYYGLDVVMALSHRVAELAASDAPVGLRSTEPASEMFRAVGDEEVLAISTVVGDAIIDLLDDPEAAQETAEAFDTLFGESGLNVDEFTAAVDGGTIRAALGEHFDDPDLPAYGVVSDTAEVVAEAFVEQSEALANGSYADDAYVVAGRTVLKAMAGFYAELAALGKPQQAVEPVLVQVQETQLFAVKELV